MFDLDVYDILFLLELAGCFAVGLIFGVADYGTGKSAKDDQADHES